MSIKLVISSWSCMIVFILFTSVRAADDIQCAIYAKTAIDQNEENKMKGCNYSWPKWSSDYGHHEKWCRRVPLNIVDSETVARAKKLIACQAEPQCSIQLNTIVRLKNVKVNDEADGSGNAEPYLWPVFFKIDLASLAGGNPIGKWVYAPNGSHGNLGKNWDARQVIPITTNIGLWETNVNSLLLPEKNRIIGVVVVLLEEDDAPSSSFISSKAYPKYVNKIVERLKKGMQDAIKSSFGPKGDGSGFTGMPLSQKIEAQIQDEMKDALSDPWWTWLLGTTVVPFLPAFVNIDDFIGAGVFMWTWEDLAKNSHQTFSKAWNENTGSEDGDFTLYGEINARTVCKQIIALKLVNKSKHQRYHDLTAVT